jgi:hypothetical protein
MNTPCGFRGHLHGAMNGSRPAGVLQADEFSVQQVRQEENPTF